MLLYDLMPRNGYNTVANLTRLGKYWALDTGIEILPTKAKKFELIWQSTWAKEALKKSSV